MLSPAVLITAPEPFLSTYDGPILTGLARGGLLDSLAWPSWWWIGLQGREELRMWASLSGSGDSKGKYWARAANLVPSMPALGPEQEESLPASNMPDSPHLPLCPDPDPLNTLGRNYPLCFQLTLKTRQAEL